MKTPKTILALSLCAAVAMTVGCGKKDEPAPAPAPATENKAGAAITEGVQKVTDAAKEAAEKAKAQAEAAKAAAEKAAAEAQAKAQGIIDSAKKLLAEGKLDQIASTLSQLQGLKLTPEQEQAVKDIKAQLEKMLKAATGNVPGVPGGLLPK